MSATKDVSGKAVSLPDLPKGKEFEEYVLSYFQCQGFYTEKNIEEKDILELDIVVTDCSEKKLESRLIEAKSGTWGMSDLFKVKGWMDYLSFNNGAFIQTRERDGQFNKQEEVARSLGIELIRLDIEDQLKPFDSDFIDHKSTDPRDFSIWRFSSWLEREMIERLVHQCKTHPHLRRYDVLRNYYQEINKDVFYSKDKASRVLSLYATFQRYPHISARCANEMSGRNFEEQVNQIPKNIFAKSFYDCDYNDIQISTFIEHKSRLAILKNTIDYHSNEPSGSFSSKDLLPVTFTTGANTLEKTHPYFHLYPVFWQWFLWVFGGFILKDYEKEEYNLLSQKTGIPEDQIPNALSAYDILFPVEDGWFVENPMSNIRMLKMFPVPFRGIGAFYRKKFYTDSKDYKNLKLTGPHTLNDLIKWNNSAVEVLFKPGSEKVNVSTETPKSQTSKTAK